MHAIARFSPESVRLSGVSATGNQFVRSVEFPVNRMVNETDERNEPVRFVRPKDSFIRTSSRTNEPTQVDSNGCRTAAPYDECIKYANLIRPDWKVLPDTVAGEVTQFATIQIHPQMACGGC